MMPPFSMMAAYRKKAGGMIERDYSK